MIVGGRIARHVVVGIIAASFATCSRWIHRCIFCKRSERGERGDVGFIVVSFSNVVNVERKSLSKKIIVLASLASAVDVYDS